jgi:transcriptional regulator with XRE-family HTH domain
MKEKLSLGDQLKRAREAAGMTQIELFEKSRVSLFTISQLENNHTKNVSTHTLRGLQYALGIVFEI